MTTTEQLTDEEYDQLFKQPPESKNDGGFQSLLVKLQRQVNGRTITLYDMDIKRIRKYSSYCPGGWENTYLTKIFGRFRWFNS